MGVPQAMLYSNLRDYRHCISPVKSLKNFSMVWEIYANVLGIIIAASVFVAGLKSTGAVDAAISFLKRIQRICMLGCNNWTILG